MGTKRGIASSRHRETPSLGFYLNLDGVEKDRAVISEAWGTVSDFKVSFDVLEFNDTLVSTYTLMKHGSDFQTNPSFRLGIIGMKAVVTIRNTGGLIEQVESNAITLPFTGIIKVEDNSLWVDDDEYPITYNMDTTWDDNVDTFIGINNNLSGGFTGHLKSFITPVEEYLCNEGSGLTITGLLGGTGALATANAGGAAWIDAEVWQPIT